MTSTPRPIRFIESAAAMLTARGWDVEVQSETHPHDSQMLFAVGRWFDGCIGISAHKGRSGRWTFHGLTRYPSMEKPVQHKTYVAARIALSVYATDYVALDARRAAREVTA